MDAINIRNLKAFLQVYRFGNLSSAASELYMTPQGMSKVIKSLEASLNVQLFVRKSHGLIPTEYGKQLAEKAPHIIRELESLASGESFSTTANNVNEISVVMTCGVMELLSLDFINSFQAQHPNIVLNISDATDAEVEHALWTEKANVAIVNGPIDVSRFQATYLYSLRNCFVVNSSNPLSQRESLSYSDLRGEKIIFPSKEFKSYSIHMNRFLRAGFTPDVLYCSTELIHAHQLCSQNCGIALSIEAYTKNRLFPNTVTVPISDKDCSLDAYVVTKAGRPIQPEVQSLIDYIIDYCRKKLSSIL